MKNIFSIGIIAVIVFMLVIGCGKSADTNKTDSSKTDSNKTASNTTSTTAEKPIAVQSKALTKEYDENELAADGKYKGKMLAVSGKISNIAETLGNITVSLEGHEMMKSVMCSFEEAEKANVMKLKKGQQVTLVGTGDGSTGGLYIGLEKCKIQ